MAELQIPNFGQLLAPHIGRVPPDGIPRFLALLERGAAERYREWAVMLAQHEGVLLRCAAGEDEIADRVEAVFALDESMRETLQATLLAARSAYYGVFDGMDVWDQLRVQANAERQGAQAWRSISATHPDPNVIAELAICSSLEEASADRLDALIAEHASS